LLNHYRIAVLSAVLLMMAAAGLRLGTEVPRLVQGTEWVAAIDLHNRYAEVQRWFDGRPVYAALSTADYPPATYAILFPFFGWAPFATTRWIWAVTMLVSLAGTAALMVLYGGASMTVERWFVALLPFSTYATAAAVTVGQLSAHVLFAVVASCLLLRQRGPSWGADAATAVLFAVALMKPTMTVPFIWIILFVPGRVRPVVLLGVVYAALTWIAATFQEGNLVSLLRGWLTDRADSISLGAGTANLSKAAYVLGVEQWLLPAAFTALCGLGWWIARHREADIWILLGVSALVARLWIHHRIYDDLLILLPMIALFRIAKRNSYPESMAAGLLLTAGLVALLLPTSSTWARLLPAMPGTSTLFDVTHATLWVLMLVFLLLAERKAPDNLGSAHVPPKSTPPARHMSLGA
jgi:hypothetical protein